MAPPHIHLRLLWRGAMPCERLFQHPARETFPSARTLILAPFTLGFQPSGHRLPANFRTSSQKHLDLCVRRFPLRRVIGVKEPHATTSAPERPSAENFLDNHPNSILFRANNILGAALWTPGR